MSATVEPPALSIITDSDFGEFIDESHRHPVLLYFTVVWCGPCEVFGPRVGAYAASNPELVIRKVDSDESPMLSDFAGVDVFPTLALVRHGRVHWTHAGALDEDALAATIGAVAGAARELGDDAEQRPAESTAYPLRLEFPDLTESRVSVEVMRRGEMGDQPDIIEPLPESGRVALREGDFLAVIAHSDERRNPPMDLSVLRDFPLAPYEHVLVSARSLSAAQISDIRSLRRVRSLMLSTMEPVGHEVVDAIATLDAHSLRCRIPGIDSESLRRRMPDVSVDHSSLSAAMAVALPGPLADPSAAATWTSVDRFREVVSSSRTVVAMVQAEHEADRAVASSWHRAMAAGRLPRVHAVSAYGTHLVTELGLEADRPTVVGFLDGSLAWRMDLPEHEEDLDGERFNSLMSHSSAVPRVRAAHEVSARAIRVSPGEATPVHIELVAPCSVEASAALDMVAGSIENVPSAWRVRIRAHASDAQALRWNTWAEVGTQELMVSGDIDDLSLEGIAALEHLEYLVVYSARLTARATATTLAKLPALRSVRVYGSEIAQDIRNEMPDLIIDGSWGLDGPAFR